MLKQGCGVIVLNEKNEILLGQRNRPKDKESMHDWCIPGGTIEKEEPAVYGAIRELKEETSLRTVDLQILCKTHLLVDEDEIVDFTFICKEYDGELEDSDELINLEFFSLEEVRGMLICGEMYPATEVSIVNYMNYLKKKDV